jgi:hypothetical protein
MWVERPDAMADLMQVITQLTDERFFGAGAGQEPSIGRQRIKGTKESELMSRRFAFVGALLPLFLLLSKTGMAMEPVARI